MPDKSARLAAFVARALHDQTPIEEARSCAVAALRLMREMGIVPEGGADNADRLHKAAYAEGYERGVAEGAHRSEGRGGSEAGWYSFPDVEILVIPRARAIRDKKGMFRGIPRATPIAKERRPGKGKR